MDKLSLDKYSGSVVYQANKSFPMGTCSSSTNPQRKQDGSQNPERSQKAKEAHSSKDQTQTDMNWKEKINKLSFEDSSGNKYSLSTLLEDDNNDQKVLKKGNESKAKDNRLRACSSCVQSFPANCIGAVKASDSDTNLKSYSTAFMISPQLALTSAHSFVCIDNSTGKLFHTIPRMMYVGLIGKCVLDNPNNYNPKYFFKVEEYRIHPKYEISLLERWKTKQELKEKGKKMSQQECFKGGQRLVQLLLDVQEYDYAIIKIKEKVPVKEFFQLKVMDRELLNSEVTVQGYQLTEGKRKEDPADFVQYFETDCVAQINKTVLDYQVSTETQQSGSPVMLRTGGDKLYVVAIHKGSYTSKESNMGTRVTYKMMEMIKQWSQEMNAQLILDGGAVIDKPLNIADENEYNFKIREIVKRKEEEYRRKDEKHQKDLLKLKQKSQEEKQHYKLQMSGKDEALKQKEEEIIALRAQIEQSNADSKSVVANSKSVALQGGNEEEIEQLQWDDRATHSDHFQIEGSLARFKQGSKRLQMISHRPFIGKQTARFTVKRYGGSNYICLGVITDLLLKEESSGEQHNSIGLMSYPSHKKGIIKVNSLTKQAFNPKWYLAEGGELSIEVDTEKNTIKFTVHDGASLTIEMPKNFVEPSKLYAYVTMGAAGDEVEMH